MKLCNKCVNLLNVEQMKRKMRSKRALHEGVRSTLGVLIVSSVDHFVPLSVYPSTFLLALTVYFGSPFNHLPALMAA